MSSTINGEVSFWYADIGGLPSYRSPLSGDVNLDVVIVGAGYTGLWTAYYLKKADPSIKIAVVEKNFAGFGASGRNGGWLSAGFGWPREKYLEKTTRSAVLAFQAAMASSVEEVIAVTQEEGIDADIVRTYSMRVATSPAQLERLRTQFEYYGTWDQGEHFEMLSLDDARKKLAITNMVGAFTRKGNARVQPAKLVRGLANAVERLGVAIYEQTAVSSIKPGHVITDRGTLNAPVIIRATEGYTASLEGQGRTWVPLNSSQIVTAPLSAELWREIGWDDNQLLADMAHDFTYAQRTRDGRIAIGNSGDPYRFGSGTDVNGQTGAASENGGAKVGHGSGGIVPLRAE